MDARARGRGIGVRCRGVLGFPRSSRRRCVAWGFFWGGCGGQARVSVLVATGDALRGFKWGNKRTGPERGMRSRTTQVGDRRLVGRGGRVARLPRMRRSLEA